MFKTRICYISFGTLTITIGLGGIYHTSKFGVGLDFLVPLVFIIYGIIMYIASRINFNGHWALPVGMAMLGYSTLVAIYILSETAHAENVQSLLLGATLTSLGGALLLNTAWRFHIMSHDVLPIARHTRREQPQRSP